MTTVTDNLNGLEPSVLDILNVFDAFFGDTVPQNGVRVHDGQIKVSYTGELDLRRKLATLARAYGWLVDEEVVVPGWGRIDLVLRSLERGEPRLIELKLDLTKPARVRRAFQQADGYGRWWATTRSEHNKVFVIGADVDADILASVYAAYPEVGYGNATAFIGWLATWPGSGLRRNRAIGRAEALRELLKVHEFAVAGLRNAEQAPEQSP